jgi:chromosome partitioning protein
VFQPQPQPSEQPDEPAVPPTSLAVAPPIAPAAPSPEPEVAELGPTGRPVRDFPVPAAPTEHGPARVVALCNQKGGVAKTTSTINLGAALAGYGYKVLLVDFDPQGALSQGLGVDLHALETSVYDLLVSREVTFSDVRLPTAVERLDILPAIIDLAAAELSLASEVAREQALARALAPAMGEYDVILIDCQPSLGLLTVNALTAAHGVIVPVEAEFFAMRGVALLMDIVSKVQERLNESLTIDGMLITRYYGGTIHAKQVMARMVEAFGDEVFHTVIPRTIRFPESETGGVPIIDYAPASPGAQAYSQLAREVVDRWAR